ncbi:MAG: DUF2905 domain-containing protein [Dehalococcoidia bacterium]
MDARQVGLLLLVIGAIVMLVGAAALAGLLGWFGRLPGDLRYDSGNVKVYAPIVSMLLISLGLSIGLAIIRRFF